MVRFGRILGKNGLSGHVWLHCKLPGCRNSLLLACRSLDCVDHVYLFCSKDIELIVILSKEYTVRTVQALYLQGDWFWLEHEFERDLQYRYTTLLRHIM
jgi:hypothetical protein